MVEIFVQSRKKLFILLALLFLIILFFSIVFLVFLLHFLPRGREVPPTETQTFLLTEYNPETNERTHGFVKLNPNQMKKDGVITYKNEENGHEFIISSLIYPLLTVYHCTGYCQDHSKEGRESLLSTKDLLFVTTYTELKAIKLAKEELYNDCVSRYRTKCDDYQYNLEAMIAKCVDTGELGPKELMESISEGVAEVVKEEHSDDDQVEGYEYSCQGHCVENPDSLGMDVNLFDCNAHDVNSMVRIPEGEAGDVKIVEEKFREDHLETYCSIVTDKICVGKVEGENNAKCVLQKKNKY